MWCHLVCLVLILLTLDSVPSAGDEYAKVHPGMRLEPLHQLSGNDTNYSCALCSLYAPCITSPSPSCKIIAKGVLDQAIQLKLQYKT